MKSLGTILPTKQSERCNDLFAKREKAERMRVGAANLSQFEYRFAEGEDRWYDGPDRFAIVGRTRKILWFERRNGEWFSTKVKVLA